MKSTPSTLAASSSHDTTRHTSNSLKFKTDLQKKSKDDLIELAIQLHQLLAKAFRDQNEVSRQKMKCHYLEKELLMAKLKNTHNDSSQVQMAAELVELNFHLKARISSLEQKLNHAVTRPCYTFERSKVCQLELNHPTPPPSSSLCLSAPLAPVKYPGKPPPYHESLKGSGDALSNASEPLPPLKACDSVSSTSPVFTNHDTGTKSRPLRFKKAPPKLCLAKHPSTCPPPNHRRLPFPWPPLPTESPPRLSCSTAHQTLSTAHVHQQDFIETPPSSTLASDVPSFTSIFDVQLKPEEQHVLSTLLADTRLDEWFTKKIVEPPHKVSALPPTKVLPVVPKKRLCVLSPAASQKYLITMRCLKKPYGAEDSWTAFKNAMYSCQLTKYQINLLLETVPDRESCQGTRKLVEWEDHVSKVRALVKQDPQVELFEEEEFVFFISIVPDLHQRLQCMLIMESFSELLDMLSMEIETLMDALEVIHHNAQLRLFFKCVLELGNRQNQDTPSGKRKWFRISALKKFIDYRGAGPHGKSILTIVVSHLGPLMEQEEMQCIEKASQVSISQLIEKATHVNYVFRLLSEPQFMQHVTHDPLWPIDSSDQFGTLGLQFARQHQQAFQELKQDIGRLLHDYSSCVTYIGDPEAFLPIDKKVQDERNPAQSRFIQDVFSFFYEILSAYKTAYKQIHGAKSGKKEIHVKTDTKHKDPCTKKTPSTQHESLPDESSSSLSSHTTQHNTPSPVLSSLTPTGPLNSPPPQPPLPFTPPLDKGNITIHLPNTSLPSTQHMVPPTTSHTSPPSSLLHLPSEQNTSQVPPPTMTCVKNINKRRASLRPALFQDTELFSSPKALHDKTHHSMSTTQPSPSVVPHDPPLWSSSLPPLSHSTCLFQDTTCSLPLGNSKRHRESIRNVLCFLPSHEHMASLTSDSLHHDNGQTLEGHRESHTQDFSAPLHHPPTSDTSQDIPSLHKPRSLLTSHTASTPLSTSTRSHHYSSLLHSSKRHLTLSERLSARRLARTHLHKVQEEEEDEEEEGYAQTQ